MPGYSISEKDLVSLDRKYLCLLCGKPLREPIQTVTCGHRYCKSCIEEILRSTNSRCVEDNVEIIPGEMFEDKFAQREILSLLVHCTNHSDGCDWTNTLRQLENHQSVCPHARIPCVHPGCGFLVKRVDLSRHLVEECSFRQEQCQFCSKTTTAARLKKHQESECQEYPVNCPKCSSFTCLRKELSHHLDPLNGNCDAIEARCPFVQLGCETAKPMRRIEFQRHLDNNVTHHLNYLFSHFQHITNEFYSKLADFNSAQGRSDGTTKMDTALTLLQQKVDAVLSNNSCFTSTLNAHDDRLEKLQKSIRCCLLEDDLLPDSASSTSHPPLLQGIISNQLLQKLDNHEAKTANHEVLLVELNSMVRDQTNEVKRLEKQLRLANEEARKLQRRTESLEHTLMLRNTALADLEEYVQQQEFSSFEGTLLWKITDFSRRKRNAVTGKEISFYSSCFYTSRYGYKMCARIYLNGDGMGKGTHISVFFVVMRGQYDALLRWPFRQKVTMMLLDQDNVEHVIDTFRPDPNSSSFQRPRREMNVASGCPLFCPLSELSTRAYVRDDTMFVKFIVDTSDL